MAIARPAAMQSFRHILVPTDFSECADHALETAVALATLLGTKLTLVHVFEPPVSSYAAYAPGLYFPTEELEVAAKTALDKAAARLRERMPNADAILEAGAPVRQILSTAKDTGADLIVMGTHGRRGISHVLLGSIAERTVRFSPVPVLTVRVTAQPEAMLDRGRAKVDTETGRVERTL
jgi:nucleotide-binding universal stress UspA family protein